MHLFVFIDGIIIIQECMLVSQTYGGAAVLFEVIVVFDKGGHVVLCDFGIGIGNDGLVNPIGVVAFHECHLSTSCHLTLPNGV